MWQGVREGLSEVTGELRRKEEKLLPCRERETHFW